ncbi:MAG: DUF2828 family protein [Anaerolineaceae bacterium]|nr:DUF2828 family protein [Anaerolineaceae bacterium]
MTHLYKSFLDALKGEANKTLTENLAVTYRSSGSECVDLFGSIGALRSAGDEEIVRRFIKAWADDRDLAMKILFYARDIRGGLGERRVFRVLLSALAEIEPESVRKNIAFVPEYGRYDDLLELLDTPCEADALAFIRDELNKDLAKMEAGEPVSLLAKWLPSVNASNEKTRKQAQIIAKTVGMDAARYRKTLSALRSQIRIIENNLREKDYTFDYSQQPSKAMFKYRKAFNRNDGERYNAYLKKVAKGESTLHTGTLMPYELVRAALSLPGKEERQSLDVTWNALEDYTDGRNALAVIDGSGSMYWDGNPRPAEIALSLGMYFAERNTGQFHDHFITFSNSPQLVQIKGKDFTERVQYCKSFNEVANTDLQAVFELILNTAIKHRLPQSEMPELLYILSDMEFDRCVEGAGLTNFEYAKQLYESHGYHLPQVIFWNVESRQQQVPVKMNDRGVALVSGASPQIFKMAMSNEMDPYKFMMKVIGSERYAQISA